MHMDKLLVEIKKELGINTPAWIMEKIEQVLNSQPSEIRFWTCPSCGSPHLPEEDIEVAKRVLSELFIKHCAQEFTVFNVMQWFEWETNPPNWIDPKDSLIKTKSYSKLDIERIEEEAYYNGMTMRPDFEKHATDISLRMWEEYCNYSDRPLSFPDWLKERK